jgi:uncharacterized protein (DUF427 family)
MGEGTTESVWDYPRPPRVESSGQHVTVELGGIVVADTKWALRGHVAFYPERVGACYVDGERVEAQPGSFYGGWVTSRIRGPFKGAPGTAGW